MKNQHISEMEQYYAGISAKIISLLKENLYEDALSMLNEELAQPYVPEDVFLRFTQSKSDIEKMLNEKQYDEKFRSLTKRDIWTKIYNEENNFIDISYISILIEKYEQEIDEFDVAMINNILKNKKISNVDKWLLVELILQFNLDYDFVIYNSFLNKQVEFSLVTLKNAQKQLTAISNSLCDELAKQPSELEIALQLLQVLHTKFIPNQITYENHVIISTLKNAVLALFNHEQLIENEITKLLKDFLG